MIEKLGAARHEMQPPMQVYLPALERNVLPLEENKRNYYRRFGRSTMAATVIVAIGTLWGAPPVTEAQTPRPASPHNCLSGCPVTAPRSVPLAANLHEVPAPPSLPPKPKPANTTPPPTVSLPPPVTTTTTLGTTRAASTGAVRYEANQGVDISWPPDNCTVPIPSDVSFGIVGVNGGKAFTSNPCFAQETAKFKGKQLQLYVNGDYQKGPAMQTYEDPRIPKAKACDSADPGFLNCVAEDYGFNAGQYAVQQASKNGITASVWWIDVETGNSWDGNTPGHNISENISSITGTMNAIEKYASEAAKTPVVVGFYSVPDTMWKSITGNWHPPDARDLNNPNLHAPNWVSKASGSSAEAEAACKGNNFTGGDTDGDTWVVQYQTGPNPVIDQDVSCK